LPTKEDKAKDKLEDCEKARKQAKGTHFLKITKRKRQVRTLNRVAKVRGTHNLKSIEKI
jgi:hypothetical protein